MDDVNLVTDDGNRIGSVIVDVLASSVVDRGFGRVKPKTIKLVFVASALNTQH